MLIAKSIVLQESRNIWSSFDKGKSWKKVENVPDDPVFLQEHPYNPKSIYTFSRSKGLLSVDEGSSWSAFQFPFELASMSKGNFAFHSTDPNKVIVQLKICEGLTCRHDVFCILR